ncbi:hypothetical protein [Segatella buccae]|uniref:hypothetical protein n=1 Tax=Segatella buccae TaxID=28126 RepID=UPI0028D03CC6|nr:hypothetical protein [Segatella buccae]
MLQRDYFLRILQEFMAAVARFLEKNEGEEQRDKEMEDLYRQYVGDRGVLRHLSLEETLTYADDQWSPDERLDRLGMLAELLYAEGSYKQNPLRQVLLDKAYGLFDYVETHGSEYSLDRRRKMEEIRKEAALTSTVGPLGRTGEQE